MDVTSLYTNIPQFEGINYTIEMLSQHPPYQLPLCVIRKLLILVLTRNSFQFNGHFFIQKNGVAMGTRVAPTFANIYLHMLESKLLQNFTHRPKFCFRYIDDIWGVWTNGLENLLKFVEYSNSAHPTIKFTLEYSSTEINFLDTTVHKYHTNALCVRLFTKSTDTHTDFRFDSSHPPHCKQNGPYGQALRIKRNNTETANEKSDLENFSLS